MTKNRTGLIYKITSPSGKSYIGQTISLYKRKYRYRKFQCQTQTHLYNSLIKYGFENHIFEILEDNIEIEKLNEKETYYIEKYDTFNNGMNMTTGGGVCHKRSVETIEKLRISATGNKNNLGKRNALGYKHTEEAKEKMSNKLKEKYENGFINPRKGVKQSKEQVEKIAKAKYREVLQYDLNNNFITEYDSIKMASQMTNTSCPLITQNCRGKSISTNGFIFKYKNENNVKKSYKLSKEVIERRNVFSKPILQFDLEGNFINEYKSAREAFRKTGICWKKISDCLRNIRKETNGFIWSYK